MSRFVQVDNLRHGETYSFRVITVAHKNGDQVTDSQSEPSKPSSPLVIPDINTTKDPRPHSGDSNDICRSDVGQSLGAPWQTDFERKYIELEEVITTRNF